MQVNEMNRLGLIVVNFVAHAEPRSVTHEIKLIHCLQRNLEKRIKIRRQD